MERNRAMDIKEVSMYLAKKDRAQDGNYEYLYLKFGTKASAPAIEKLIRITDVALKSAGIQLKYGPSITDFFSNRGIKFT